MMKAWEYPVWADFEDNIIREISSGQKCPGTRSPAGSGGHTGPSGRGPSCSEIGSMPKRKRPKGEGW